MPHAGEKARNFERAIKRRVRARGATSSLGLQYGTRPVLAELFGGEPSAEKLFETAVISRLGQKLGSLLVAPGVIDH